MEERDIRATPGLYILLRKDGVVISAPQFERQLEDEERSTPSF